MKCSNCGAELESGVAFCTACGTPAPASTPTNTDNDKTVLVSSDAFNLGQPPQSQGVQPSFGQPQNMQNNFGQPQGMHTGFGQPQDMHTGFGQPQGMQNGFGQPQNMQNGFRQPQGMQPNFGQPQNMQNGFGQPQGMQPNYGQPQNMQNSFRQPTPPRPPRKPLSKKAKMGILWGSIGAVILIVFFAVILPILLKADLKGSYCYTSGGSVYTAVFDDNTYVIYDDDGDIYEAGIYSKKDNKVTLKDVNGSESTAVFNAKDNRVRIYGNSYKSEDKKKTLDFKLTDNYIENLQAKLETTCAELITDEDLYDDLYWNSCWIYDDALKNADTDFEKALVNAIGYNNDAALQALIESGYLDIDIYLTYDGKLEISCYAY